MFSIFKLCLVSLSWKNHMFYWQITATLIWAVAWDFQQCGMCDQQSLRSACAYAQSDQSLCWSLEYSMSVKPLTELDLEFLGLKGGCIGSAESTLVKIPHCWKSHVTAHIRPDVGWWLTYIFCNHQDFVFITCLFIYHVIVPCWVFHVALSWCYHFSWLINRE